MVDSTWLIWHQASGDTNKTVQIVRMFSTYPVTWILVVVVTCSSLATAPVRLLTVAISSALTGSFGGSSFCVWCVTRDTVGGPLQINLSAIRAKWDKYVSESWASKQCWTWLEWACIHPYFRTASPTVLSPTKIRGDMITVMGVYHLMFLLGKA